MMISMRSATEDTTACHPPKKVPQCAVNLDTELTGGANHDDKLVFAPVNYEPVSNIQAIFLFGNHNRCL
jgi:hypothetical protein